MKELLISLVEAVANAKSGISKGMWPMKTASTVVIPEPQLAQLELQKLLAYVRRATPPTPPPPPPTNIPALVFHVRVPNLRTPLVTLNVRIARVIPILHR